MSPEDTHSRLMRKLADYETMGVPQIWVIDPKAGSFHRYRNDELIRSHEFDEPSKGIRFDLRELVPLLD